MVDFTKGAQFYFNTLMNVHDKYKQIIISYLNNSEVLQLLEELRFEDVEG